MNMESCVAVVFLLLAPPAQLLPAQMSLSPDEGHSGVMLLQEVLVKSMCRPMEQLVDVKQEHPGGVEHIYVPDCVSLWRCSGCCMDDYLECHPTLERNITLQVMRIRPMISQRIVHLTFVEHQGCECRLRVEPLSDKSESIRNRPRKRKHMKAANGCGKCQNKTDLH